MPANVETVAIDSLKPYPGNARRGDLSIIRESLREHGQFRTIVVQKSTRYVLAGNHTWMAAKEEGWSNINVEWADVDDNKAKKIVLVDNRANDVAGYDIPSLADLLQSVDSLDGTGFNDEALAQVMAALDNTVVLPDAAEETPSEPKVPKTVEGDLYVLGRHRLLCGDSTSIDAVEKLMAGQKAKLLFTDPPYGVDYDGGHKKREKLANDQAGTEIYAEMMPSVLAACDERAPLYVWHADKFTGVVCAALEGAGYTIRNSIVWVKNNAQFVSGAQYKHKHEPCLYAFKTGKKAYWYGPNNETTVWEVDRESSNKLHPTQKPVALAERAMRNSTRSGDPVLDLFGGSGATLVAAESLGRACYMMELNPAYCDVIVERWENLTGEKAVLNP